MDPTFDPLIAKVRQVRQKMAEYAPSDNDYKDLAAELSALTAEIQAHAGHEQGRAADLAKRLAVAQEAATEALAAAASAQKEASVIHEKATRQQKRTAWATIAVAVFSALAATAAFLTADAGKRAASAAQTTAGASLAALELQNRPHMVVALRWAELFGTSGFLVVSAGAKNLGKGLALHANLRTLPLSSKATPPTYDKPVFFRGTTSPVPVGDSVRTGGDTLYWGSVVGSVADTAFVHIECVYYGAETGSWYLVHQVFGMVPERAIESARLGSTVLGAVWPHVTYEFDCRLDSSGGLRIIAPSSKGVPTPLVVPGS